jgi:hypothetical protein
MAEDRERCDSPPLFCSLNISEKIIRPLPEIPAAGGLFLLDPASPNQWAPAEVSFSITLSSEKGQDASDDPDPLGKDHGYTFVFSYRGYPNKNHVDGAMAIGFDIPLGGGGR